LTARAGTLLVYCHRCKRRGLEIIRALVDLGLLPNWFRESSAAFALLKQIRAAIYSAEWNGTARATDLLVLCALDEIIKASLKTKFGASVRQIAERAQIDYATASRSLRRLTKTGWIEKIAGARDGNAAVWCLRLPQPDRSATIPRAGKEGDRLLPADPFFGEGGRANQNRPVACFRHEVFRRGRGLGPIKGRIYALLAAKPLTTREIAAR
jgi:hypothetical protein